MFVCACIKKHFIPDKFFIASDYIGANHFHRMTNMRVGIYIRKSSCNIESFRSFHVFSLLGRTVLRKLSERAGDGFIFFYIREIFHEHAGDWYRNDEPHEASKLASDNESKDRDKRRNTDNLFYHQRIDKLILKLLDDDIKSHHQQSRCHAIGNQSHCHGRNSRKHRTKKRNDFKHTSKHSEQERIFYLK